jgi:uncharacterized protein YkwD
MREMVSGVARKGAVVVAVLGIAAGLTACNSQPDCRSIKSQFADAPVKNIAVADAEKAVFCLTNDERTSRGLPAYSLSSLLGRTARAHADDAVARKWWNDGADPHTNPDGKTPADRVRAAGYCPNGSWRVHENVYWGWGSPLQTARDAVRWWMGSPGHRANILDAGLREIGVGVAKGAPRPGTYPDAAVFVQNFAVCS